MPRQIANALFLRGDTVLLAKRSGRRRSYANCWSFPGGHVEPGESLEHALIREAREEIGLTPQAFRPLAIIPEPDPNRYEDAVYHLYAVTEWNGGDPRICDGEHSELRWVDLDIAGDLQPLALAAYRDVFRTLRMAPFLAASAAIDLDHPAVRALAAELRRSDPLATVQTAYQTVRDRYAHSYDVAAREVSVSGSDVLRHGHGICFAKAHLLAAVLRANAIPAALCYQRLARDDLPGMTCLHGLNAVWLAATGRWHRLDPRGNRPATAAPFDPDCERFAYAIDPARGERDYPEVYAAPLPAVIAALRCSATIAELDRNLPADIG